MLPISNVFKIMTCIIFWESKKETTRPYLRTSRQPNGRGVSPIMSARDAATGLRQRFRFVVTSTQ